MKDDENDEKKFFFWPKVNRMQKKEEKFWFDIKCRKSIKVTHFEKTKKILKNLVNFFFFVGLT